MRDKAWFRLSCIYVGCVVGAGFASGQEIMKFFTMYGFKGILGSVIACILFMIIGAMALSWTYKQRAKNFNDLFRPLLGSLLMNLFEIVIMVFLFAGYCVMLSGSGAIVVELFGCGKEIGVYIMSGAVFLVLINNVKGIADANSLLVPILVLAIVAISVLAVKSQGNIMFSNFYGGIQDANGWWIASLLYVSYNSVPAIVVLSTTLDILPNKKNAVLAGISGGVILLIMSFFIMIPLLIFDNDVRGTNIPMLAIAGRMGLYAEYIYSGVLLIAMFTTAIGNAFGFVKRCMQFTGLKISLISLVVCLMAIPFSKFRFAKLVHIMYPILGYIGMVLFVIMILKFLYIKVKGIFIKS